MFERVIRELKWLGAGAGLGTVIVIAMIADGAPSPRSEDYPVVALVGLAPWFLASLVRLLIWMLQGHARTFQLWPEVIIIIGVLLLAYGGSGLFDHREDDTDRYLFALGATLCVGALLVRRRGARPRKATAGEG